MDAAIKNKNSLYNYYNYKGKLFQMYHNFKYFSIFSYWFSIIKLILIIKKE